MLLTKLKGQDTLTVNAAEKEYMRKVFNLDTLENFDNSDFMDGWCYPFIKAAGYSNPELAKVADEKAREVSVPKQDIIKMLIDSRIPHVFVPTKDGNKTNLEYNGNAYAKADSFINDYKKGTRNPLYISGDSYRGKSRLAAYIGLQLIKIFKKVYWLNVPSFHNAIVESFKNDLLKSGVQEIYDVAKNAEVLILDDVAKFPVKSGDGVSFSYFGEKLYALKEYRKNKPQYIDIHTGEQKITDESLTKILTASIINRIKNKSLLISCESKQNFDEWDIKK